VYKRQRTYRLRDVAWSSDSKRIAFVADLAGDVTAAQVWTAAADGSAPVKHAELKGYAQAPRFSPDGSRLSILFIEGMPRAAGPLQPMTPLAGVIDEKIYEQRIAIIDLSSDHLTQVTPADMYVYEYDWMPDGQGWAATAVRGSGDANWWIARLYRVNATGEMREIYKMCIRDRLLACWIACRGCKGRRFLSGADWISTLRLSIGRP